MLLRPGKASRCTGSLSDCQIVPERTTTPDDELAANDKARQEARVWGPIDLHGVSPVLRITVVGRGDTFFPILLDLEIFKWISVST